MIRSLLETGELQHAVPHLGQAEASDAEHFALESHHVSEELHVPGVNVHSAHDEADLINDGLTRRFDAENLAHLHDRIGPGGEAIDPFGRHAITEAVAFDQQGVLAGIVRFDDGAGSFGVAADGNVWEDALDQLHAEIELRIFFRGGFRGDVLGTTPVLFQSLDVDADVVFVVFEIAFFQLEFLLPRDRVDDISDGDI